MSNPDFDEIAAALAGCSKEGGNRKKRGGVLVPGEPAKRRFEVAQPPRQVNPAPAQPAAAQPAAAEAAQPAAKKAATASNNVETGKISEGLRQIDVELRRMAGDAVRNNLWKIVLAGAGAGVAGACIGPGAALLPIVLAFLAAYDKEAAAQIQGPEQATVSVLEDAIYRSKTRAQTALEKRFAAAAKDEQDKAAKLRDALERLTKVTADIKAKPTQPALGLVERIKGIFVGAPKPTELPAVVAAIDAAAPAAVAERQDDFAAAFAARPGAVAVEREPSAALPEEGMRGGRRRRFTRRHRHRRLSAPTRKRRSSSARRRGGTR